MASVGARRALFLSVICLLLAACGGESEQSGARNRIVYGLTLQPSGFDPHIHASSELGIPLRSVYDTLVYRDPASGQFVPGLAESWEISADGLIYTFRLRSGVRFHDGTIFNAQAVAANLDRITNPETASQRALFLLGPYDGYEIVDALTIRIRLLQPYAPLLDALSQVYLGMASPTALRAYSNERYQFHQVGTGPFRFVEYVPGDRLVLQRNPDYAWGPSFYAPPGEQSVDEIEFRFFTDAATRALALESGDADVMGELLPLDARALTANTGVEIAPVPIPGQPLQFLMNTTLFPTNDVRVRQALLFGANREAIVDAVFQRYSPIAWGPLSAVTDYFSRDLVGSYAYDPTRAQTLLANAGMTDTDGSGYVDFGSVDVTVRVIVPPWGLIPEVAQLLQDQWRLIGIRAELVPVPSRSTLIEEVNGGQYNLVAFYEFGRDPSFLRRYFSTDGVNNWTGYSNPDLDLLLQQAETQSDTEARQSLYGQAQRIIMEQALLLPVRDYVNLNGQRTGLEGLSYDAFGWFPLLNNLTITNG